VFPDEATGYAASPALLSMSRYSKLTIDEAVAKRSPPEENDIPKVQEAVRVIGGFSGIEIINELDADEHDRLANAIKISEGWREGIVINIPAK
jgi:hypothetical protein